MEPDDRTPHRFEALARNDYKAGLSQLREIESAVSTSDMRVLVGLCEARISGSSNLDADGATFVPLRLLAAALVGKGRTRSLSNTFGEIDRLAPTRYFIEAAIAARGGGEARLSAALELAQVTGEARFAMAVFVATQIVRFDQLDVAARSKLSRIAAELDGPLAETLQEAVEKLDGK